MKQVKKLIITALIFIFVFTLTDIPSISNPVVVQAATIKLTKKTLTLEVGKTATLKVTGTKKTVKWSSGDKTIATVSSKGKVTAKAVGKTKITAAVNGKKLYCTVTVKEPANPYLAKAPFKAQEKQIGNINFVMPADWTLDYELSSIGISATLAPNDTSNPSRISIQITPFTGEVSYEDLKAQCALIYTQSYFEAVYNAQAGDMPFTITGLASSDLSSSSGNVVKTEYTFTVEDISLTQQVYDFILGSFIIEIASGNANGTDLSSIIEYTINSIIIKE